MVEFTENLGDVCILHVRTAWRDEPLVLKQPSLKRPIPLGHAIGIRPSEDALVFRADGTRVTA